MSDADRQILERVARSQTAAHREVVRARVLLDAADGVGNRTIAARHDVSGMTVRAGAKRSPPMGSRAGARWRLGGGARR